MPTKVQQDRLNNGLCPNCGKEAAPYRLCGDCRIRGKLNRILRRGTKLGVFDQVGSGRKARFKLGPNPDADVWRADPKDDDRRLLPRLNRIPVDVEKTLINLLVDAGRPCHIDEIMAAWGRLRTERRGPIAHDMSRLIAAQQKRDERAARRARRAGPGNGNVAFPTTTT